MSSDEQQKDIPVPVNTSTQVVQDDTAPTTQDTQPISAPPAEIPSTTSPAASAPKSKPKAKKTKPKARRTRRRRGEDDEDEDVANKSDGSASSSQSDSASGSDTDPESEDEDEEEDADVDEVDHMIGQASSNSTPAKGKKQSAFADASSTTPQAWADETLGGVEEVSFSAFNRGESGSSVKGKNGERKELTEAQLKKLEEKRAKLKEKRKAKQRERKEAAAAAKSGEATTTPAVGDEEPTQADKPAPEMSKRAKAKARKAKAENSTDIPSLVASTSNLAIDDDGVADWSEFTPTDRKASTSKGKGWETVDPSNTPRVGSFWTHDQRYSDSDRNGFNEGFRGRGGFGNGSRGGRGRGRGGAGVYGGYGGYGHQDHYGNGGGEGRGQELTELVDKPVNEDGVKIKGKGKSRTLEMDKLEAELEDARARAQAKAQAEAEEEEATEAAAAAEAEAAEQKAGDTATDAEPSSGAVAVSQEDTAAAPQEPAPVKPKAKKEAKDKWGHEGFESMSAVEAMHAVRAARGRGRGRGGFMPRGGFAPRGTFHPRGSFPQRHFGSPAHNAPETPSPLNGAAARTEESLTQPASETLLNGGDSVQVNIPGSESSTSTPIVRMPGSTASKSSTLPIVNIPSVPEFVPKRQQQSHPVAPPPPYRPRADAPAFVQPIPISQPSPLPFTNGAAGALMLDPATAGSPQPFPVLNSTFTGSENGSLSSNGHYPTQPGFQYGQNGEYQSNGSSEFRSSLPSATARQFYPSSQQGSNERQRYQKHQQRSSQGSQHQFYPSYSPDPFAGSTHPGESFSPAAGPNPTLGYYATGENGASAPIYPGAAFTPGSQIFLPARTSRISIKAPTASSGTSEKGPISQVASESTQGGQSEYARVAQQNTGSERLQQPNPQQQQYYSNQYNPYATGYATMGQQPQQQQYYQNGMMDPATAAYWAQAQATGQYGGEYAYGEYGY